METPLAALSPEWRLERSGERHSVGRMGAEELRMGEEELKLVNR